MISITIWRDGSQPLQLVLNTNWSVSQVANMILRVLNWH
jgi:hypothetical protein